MSTPTGAASPRSDAGVSSQVRARAALSGGTSSGAILRAVRSALERRSVGRGVVADVGAGAGDLYRHISEYCAEYLALDAVRYDGLPEVARFLACDVGAGPLPLPEASADCVFAVEVIEHLENPRALMRELARIARPGAWVVVTTPNQASLLSVLSLVFKGRFPAFADANYPAHLTALLPVDLLRMGAECGLEQRVLEWSLEGRIPGTAWHWPATVVRLGPGRLSDNVLLLCRKPGP